MLASARLKAELALNTEWPNGSQKKKLPIRSPIISYLIKTPLNQLLKLASKTHRDKSPLLGFADADSAPREDTLVPCKAAEEILSNFSFSL